MVIYLIGIRVGYGILPNFVVHLVLKEGEIFQGERAGSLAAKNPEELLVLVDTFYLGTWTLKAKYEGYLDPPKSM